MERSEVERSPYRSNLAQQGGRMLKSRQGSGPQCTCSSGAALLPAREALQRLLRLHARAQPRPPGSEAQRVLTPRPDLPQAAAPPAQPSSAAPGSR